jgi:hypothetical protein
MITLEIGGMSYSKKITYFISKILIPQNERKHTGLKVLLPRLSVEIDGSQLSIRIYSYFNRPIIPAALKNTSTNRFKPSP